jgi:hypothetical protein
MMNTANKKCVSCKLSRAQLVRFFMVESIYLDLNLRFDINVTYLQLIIFLVIIDVPINNDALLVTL